MAFAPHTNTDVQLQLRAGKVPTELPLVLGGFRHSENDHWYEYAERRHPDDDFAPEMPHTLYLNFAETRLAKVLKTVAYVVVDEDENGPVIEKWHLRGHREYDTEWVRA